MPALAVRCQDQGRPRTVGEDLFCNCFGISGLDKVSTRSLHEVKKCEELIYPKGGMMEKKKSGWRVFRVCLIFLLIAGEWH